MSSMPSKDEFFAAMEFVIYGLSPNRKTFAQAIKDEMEKRGQKIFAIDRSGKSGFADLKSIPTKVDRAIVALSPKNTSSVIDELVQAKIDKVFLQQGSYNKEVLAQLKDRGLQVHTGCALMYMSNPIFLHRFHRFFHEFFGGAK
jgi:predicted CoA-binding protein